MALLQYRPGGGYHMVGSTKGGPPGPPGPPGTTKTETYATAFSTTDQTLSHTGVGSLAKNLAVDTVGVSSGITVTTGANAKFAVPAAGVYKYIYSIQLLGSGNGGVYVWLKVNGSNLSNSTTYTKYKNGDESVLVTEFILDLSANDEVQTWALVESANCNINYIVAGGTAPDNYPAAPGIIINMYRLA